MRSGVATKSPAVFVETLVGTFVRGLTSRTVANRIAEPVASRIWPVIIPVSCWAYMAEASRKTSARGIRMFIIFSASEYTPRATAFGAPVTLNKSGRRSSRQILRFPSDAPSARISVALPGPDLRRAYFSDPEFDPAGGGSAAHQSRDRPLFGAEPGPHRHACRSAAVPRSAHRSHPGGPHL